MSEPVRIDADATAPVGSVTAVRLDGAAFAVVHHAEGWAIVEDRCPHAGCSFAEDGGEVADGKVLVCACHGSEFDLRTGAVLQGPATEPVDVMPLVERDGALLLEESS